MAFIVQTFHLPNTKEEDIKKPILYVDSLNVSSYAVEMSKICVSYVRANTEIKPTDDKLADSHRFRTSIHSVKHESEIRDKPDSYYFVANDKDNIFVMYKKYKSVGYIFNTTIINKIFTLTCISGKKVCPKVFDKGPENKAISFEDELKARVAKYRDRAEITDKSMILTPKHVQD